MMTCVKRLEIKMQRTGSLKLQKASLQKMWSPQIIKPMLNLKQACNKLIDHLLFQQLINLARLRKGQQALQDRPSKGL